MSHFTYPPGTPTGTVPLLYAVPSTDWKHVIDAVYASINGDGGGTWAPSAFITVGGSGFQLTGTGHEIAGSARLTIQSLGELRVANGGLIKIDGTSGDIRIEVVSNVAKLTVQAGATLSSAGALDLESTCVMTAKSGSEIDLASGSSVIAASGSTIEMQAGSTCSVAGDFDVESTGVTTWKSGSNLIGAAGAFLQWTPAAWFADLNCVSSSWPSLAPSRSWSRGAAVLIPMSYTGGATSGPSSPDIWTAQSNIKNSPCYLTSDLDASGGASVLEFRDLPIGATITSVTITTRGTVVAGAASTLPTYRIVSWVDSNAADFTTHSSLTTDGAVAATFPTVTTQTTIAATGSPTVTAGRRYGLLITHPYQAVTNQGMRIYECTMNGTATSMRI